VFESINDFEGSVRRPRPKAEVPVVARSYTAAPMDNKKVADSTQAAQLCTQGRLQQHFGAAKECT